MPDGQRLSTDPGPMVRRQRLGSALRHFRIAAGLSVKEAAEQLLVAPSTISRIEKAQRNAALRDVRSLCDLYGISDATTREELMELARGGRERGWWEDAPLSPALKTYIGMEGSAATISEFQILAVPALLQTREYAEAIGAVYFPDDPRRLKLVVDARMRRQELLERENPPTYRAIIDQAALSRVVGGRATMQKQLEHLLSKIDQSLAEIRIIPFLSGAHIGMDSGFTILTFPQPAIAAAGPAIRPYPRQPQRALQPVVRRFDRRDEVAG